MKRVVLPGSEKEGDGSKSSKQVPDSSLRPVVEYEEEENVSSGPRRVLPEELMGVLVPSLKVGAAGGIVGMFFGAAAGIIRTNTPVMFSIFAGFQWAVLSSSFYGSRQLALQFVKEKEEPSPREKVKASAIAGVCAGTAGGLIRGPKNIVPGAIFWSLFGAGGQAALNAWYKRRAEAGEKKESGGFLASKWSPLKKLSDEEYEMIIQEKLLGVEAEMAMLDDQINELRAGKAQRASQQASEKGDQPSS
ncbi:hypothetical protein V8F33_013043 [Rhypophila sp. PSN 637]